MVVDPATAPEPSEPAPKVTTGKMKMILATLHRRGPVMGVASGATGVVLDVLEPIAPFAFGFFVASAIALAAVFSIYLAWEAARARVLPALVFLLIFGGVTGGLSWLQTADDADNGVLAGAIPGIEALQEKLGILQKEVQRIGETADRIDARTTEIADTTERTAETTERVDERTAEIAETADRIDERTTELAETSERTAEASERTADATEEIAAGIQDIRAGFEALRNLGGIKADPTTPQDFYHNAVVEMTGGNEAAARRSLERFFSFQPDYVDPHLEYQRILKAQEGLVGARQVYADLEQDTLSYRFGWALLQPGSARTAALLQLTRDRPEFAPALYMLSREHSLERLGRQTLSDRCRERDLLQAFREQDQAGNLLRYFLDKRIAEEWREDAQARWQSLQAGSALLENPVHLTGSTSNSGTTLVVQINDLVREILYRIGGEGEFKSTGSMPHLDPRTGLPMASQIIPARRYPPGPVTVEIKWIDVNGVENGPVQVVHDQAAAAVAEAKRIHNTTASSWVTFGSNMGRTLVYFSHLVAPTPWRNAIQEVRYSLDSEALDRVYPLEGEVYMEVPAATRSVAVQILYVDGTRSEVQVFRKE